MPQSLANVVVHIVFSTKNRIPFLINNDIRAEMHTYLGGTCKSLNCPVLIVGGRADHVHILCALSRTLSMADAIGEMKRSSSKWMKTKGKTLSKFSWQNGYGVFSVGRSEIERVRDYIASQEEHHHKREFQSEYRMLLERYEIDYDEQYVWD